MQIKTDELRSTPLEHLITPAELASEFPITDSIAQHVTSVRQQVEGIIKGHDQRLLVIVGPCSIHDPEAALDYARRLAPLCEQYKDTLCIVMRTYFEKPRTIVGWKGLVSDPDLDGSFQVNKGIRLARKLLVDINRLGVPTATEFLDMVTGQYFADLISWGAIGARTTESQIHREMASALSCPVGFKNGTDGNVKIASDAVRASMVPHIFYSPDKDGRMVILRTAGNPAAHVILRGGKQPNYSAEEVDKCCKALASVGLSGRVIIDFSHGNSQKAHKNQLLVADDVCAQLNQGSHQIAGVMIESFIEEGNQAVTVDEPLQYGKSITDACIHWQDTENVLAQLSSAAQARLSGLES